MPFIENVFTYGDTSPQIPGIKITLKVADNIISFEVMSYAKENKGESTGSFSLKNIKRRLDLLFGNNYSLEIKNEDKMNLIKLKINL